MKKNIVTKVDKGFTHKPQIIGLNFNVFMINMFLWVVSCLFVITLQSIGLFIIVIIFSIIVYYVCYKAENFKFQPKLLKFKNLNPHKIEPFFLKDKFVLINFNFKRIIEK